MPAANDNQGLKIAVAVFVALTVILAVTTYFGFSNAATAEAKAKDYETKVSNATREIDQAKQNLGELQKKSGFTASEDFAAFKDAITKHNAKLGEKLTDLQKKVGEMVAQYKAAGGSDQKIQELQAATGQIISGFQTEPNQTFQSQLDRMMELTSNQTQLAMAVTLDNETLRRDLANNNKVNQEKLDVEVAAAKKHNDDLNAEHAKHEQERAGLTTKVDQLQTLNNQQATRIQALENEINRMKQQHDAVLAQNNKLLRYYKEKAEESEIVLDKPSGVVTYVDWMRNEVRVNLTQAMGVRPQMVFSVFDRDSPGLPTEYPKAVIEIVWVGSRDAVARIDTAATKEMRKKVNPRTGRQAGPIRVGDLVYSPAFSPEEPQKFALLGKIDIDRDGRDDRDDLKRMIRAAGGEVVYDLPPPFVGSKESGNLSDNINYYVIDNRKPYRAIVERVLPKANAEEESKFEARKAEVQQKLRDSGVRPIQVEKLLGMLGYNFRPAMAIPGQVEAIDRAKSEELLRPKGSTGQRPPAAAQPETPAPSEDKGDAEKKDEGKDKDKEEMPEPK
jgi:hypothetical protein